MPSSLIEELQGEAINQCVEVSVLLRKALVVATKLNVREFEIWTNRELAGYRSDDLTPEYRKIQGRVVARNPIHGWQPVHFKDSEVEQALSNRVCHEPVSEIETWLLRAIREGTFHIPFPHDLQRDLTNGMRGCLPMLDVSVSLLRGIVESVRTIVLKWTLKLEKDGILGTGLSFSRQEKEAAALAGYQVINFYGSVTNSQIQQGTINSRQDADR